MKRTTHAILLPRPARITSESADERELARLAAQLPDAAPSDVLVARVWGRLEDPRSRESRFAMGWGWATASVVALTMVAGAGLVWRHGATPSAEIVLAEGSVFQAAKGAGWVPARRGDPLAVGASLRSVESGRGVLRLPEVAGILLGSDAAVSLEALRPATVLDLQRGTVTARVTKRPVGQPFSVRAGEFVVTVVGTLFSVSEAAAADGHTVVSVSVSEGVVEVSGRGDRWRVEAGSRWSSEAPRSRLADDTPHGAGALLGAALTSRPSGDLPQLLGEVGSPAAVVEAAPPREILAPQPVVAETTRASHEGPPARAHPQPVRLARLDRPAQEWSAEVRQPPVVLASEVVPPAELPNKPAPSVAAPPPRRDLYLEALGLSRQGEHGKAAALLERALATDGEPHDLELYQLALLRQRHLHDAQGALDALMSYRRQFPEGALRQEVDLSVMEVDRALGRTEAALSESARFLAQHPQSERADEVRVLRGDLLRQRGDCVRAATEYRAVGGGASLDDALYYLAYCQRQLGDGTSAARALQDYLTRFPAGHHADAAREALGR